MNGLIVMAPSCVNSLYPSAEESWEEMTKTEPRNKMLYSPGSTWFRPVTWSSGHLGRRILKEKSASEVFLHKVLLRPPPSRVMDASGQGRPRKKKLFFCAPSDLRWPRAVAYFQTKSCKIVSYLVSYSAAISVFWRKGRGGCAQNIGHEHDFCQAEKAESTDPRTNYAVKYATARGHLSDGVKVSQRARILKKINLA